MAKRLTDSRFSVGRVSLCAFDTIVLTGKAPPESLVDSGRDLPQAVFARPPLLLAFRHGRDVFASQDI